VTPHPHAMRAQWCWPRPLPLVLQVARMPWQGGLGSNHDREGVNSLSVTHTVLGSARAVVCRHTLPVLLCLYETTLPYHL
jgi:hypothetical protein